MIEHGANFDGERICWSGELGDLIGDCDGILFTGLLYELYKDGNLAYYSFYENGVQNGISIEFYLSGSPKSYGVFHQGLLVEKSFEWYENGRVKMMRDHCNNDYHYKFVTYDIEGNITKQGEA